jgi:hypothetical protein
VIGDRLGLLQVREVPRAGYDDPFAEDGEVFRQEPAEVVPGDLAGGSPAVQVDAPSAI